jgi:hypothetical protein
MKKNFAQSSDNELQSINRLDTLTANDLTFGVNPCTINEVFTPAPLFVKNFNSQNTKTMKTFHNQTGSEYGGEYGSSSSSSGGGFFSGIDIGDIFKGGLEIFGNIEKDKQAQQAAEIARQQAEAERARAMAEAERAKAAAAKAGADIVASKSAGQETKAWVLPVAIGGGVLILGIATYFIFRSKK